VSAPKLAIHDGRQLADVQVARSALSVIGERIPRGRVSATRSVFLALLEAAGEATPWTRRAIADRAGVGTGLVKDAVEALEVLGLLRVLVDGSWQLVTPSAEAPPLPEVELKGGPLDGVDPELRARAEKFYVVHVGRVEQIRGGRPARTDLVLAAAVRILRKEPNPHEILARLDWALGQRFYADKVLSLGDFERWYGRISAAYLADKATEKRAPREREVVPFRPHGSYESERLEVRA
jgi:hypothetical protein